MSHVIIKPALVQVTVVLERMFHPSEMEEEATLREDLEDDIKTECLKMGPLEKVVFSILHKLHVNNVELWARGAMLAFSHPQHALIPLHRSETWL